MTERMRVPSPLTVYNAFYRIYFSYFRGHGFRPAKSIPDNMVGWMEEFVQDHLGRLGYSMKTFEDYVLWIFSKHGSQPVTVINTLVSVYLKEEKEGGEIKPFSIAVGKFIRKMKLKSWEEYLRPQGGRYPLILQQYIKEKDIPFEFLLYMRVIDHLPEIQKKMVKSILGKELYKQKDRWEKVQRNEEFLKEEIRRIDEAFKATL